MLFSFLLTCIVGLGLSMGMGGTDESMEEEDQIPEYESDTPETGGDFFADTHEGDAAANTLPGSDGDDIISAHAGDDTVTGAAGDDLIYLGAGDDLVDTRMGSDDDQGDDTIYGGAGDDFITDVTGSNTLYGNEGNDTLYSVDGFDLGGGFGTLSERGTPDLLDGGAGDDQLLGDGDDTLTGGAGSDIFLINETPQIDGETAVITDFNLQEDVFTVLNLNADDPILDVTFRANANDTAVFAYVNGQPVAVLEGLSARDIPNIETALTS